MGGEFHFARMWDIVYPIDILSKVLDISRASAEDCVLILHLVPHVHNLHIPITVKSHVRINRKTVIVRIQTTILIGIGNIFAKKRTSVHWPCGILGMYPMYFDLGNVGTVACVSLYIRPFYPPYFGCKLTIVCDAISIAPCGIVLQQYPNLDRLWLDSAEEDPEQRLGAKRISIRGDVNMNFSIRPNIAFGNSIR